MILTIGTIFPFQCVCLDDDKFMFVYIDTRKWCIIIYAYPGTIRYFTYVFVSMCTCVSVMCLFLYKFMTVLTWNRNDLFCLFAELTWFQTYYTSQLRPPWRVPPKTHGCLKESLIHTFISISFKCSIKGTLFGAARRPSPSRDLEVQQFSISTWPKSRICDKIFAVNLLIKGPDHKKSEQ